MTVSINILALDTSEAYCSAALVLADGRKVSKQEHLGRGHAERLLPMVEELFAETGAGYACLDKVAVTTGPGTFTGLRIGLSVARGIALANAIPCIGLSSLSVLAAQVSYRGLVHAVMMGRGGQVFYQAFEGNNKNGLPKAISNAQNLDADAATLQIEANAGFVLGSGVPAVMGREVDAEDAIDPLVLAQTATALNPALFPPEPFYLRAADAVKAKPVFISHEGPTNA